jgi:hypothetical protein
MGIYYRMSRKVCQVLFDTINVQLFYLAIFVQLTLLGLDAT